MTPSANRATAAACSPLETPSPTHTGRSVTSRVRRDEVLGGRVRRVSRVPVTPIVDAA